MSGTLGYRGEGPLTAPTQGGARVEENPRRTSSLASLLRESTARYPDKPPVAFGETVLTYRGARSRRGGLRSPSRSSACVRGRCGATLAGRAAVHRGVLCRPVPRGAGGPLNVLLHPRRDRAPPHRSDAVALVAWESVVEGRRPPWRGWRTPSSRTPRPATARLPTAPGGAITRRSDPLAPGGRAKRSCPTPSSATCRRTRRREAPCKPPCASCTRR
jgi:hypothetical protein